MVDIHRLPQTQVFGGDNLRRDRPIIVKLGDYFSKRLFMNGFKNLKVNNKNIREENPNAPYMFLYQSIYRQSNEELKTLNAVYILTIRRWLNKTMCYP